MEAFDLDAGNLLTVEDALIMKFGDKHREYAGSVEYLHPIMGMAIADLDFYMLKELAKKLLDTPRYLKHGSKTKRLPTITTITRKFAYLSSALSNLKDKGHNITNHALDVVRWLKNME